MNALKFLNPKHENWKYLSLPRPPLSSLSSLFHLSLLPFIFLIGHE